jgi:hypothetical protein
MEEIMPKASVKVMNSHDYCHFEVCLGTDEDISLNEVNEMRKDAQRLVDKAIEQYKIAKKRIPYQYNNHKSLEKEVQIIKENYPMSEWTPDQKAKVKALADFQYYDYQNDWYEDDQY